MTKIKYGLWLAIFLNVSFYSATGATQALEAWTPKSSSNYSLTKSKIQSFDDFYDHTVLHVGRVALLGNIAAAKFYPEIDPNLVRKFLSAHDKFKLQNWRHSDSVLRTLYSIFGKNENTMDSLQKLQRQQAIDFMLESELEFNKKFFAEMGHYSKDSGFDAIAMKLLRIEKYADLTDRAKDPMAEQEFGRKMAPISKFLKIGIPDRIIIDFLESNYDKIVKGLRYQDRVAKRCSVYLESPVH